MAQVQIINLTPHALTLQTPAGERVVLPPSGTVARVSTTPGAALPPLEGVPVPVFSAPTLGDVVGLPPPSEGVLFVVSALVLAHPAVKVRRDVVGPGTGPADGAVRNAQGQIEAVTRLVRG